MAILKSAQRNRLKPSNFAIEKQRKYPIPDVSHARNALSRVSQYGDSEEKAEVRAKVHNKFPDIGESDRAEGGRVEGNKAKIRLDRPHKKKG